MDCATEPDATQAKLRFTPGPWRTQARHPAGVQARHPASWLWDTILRDSHGDLVAVIYPAFWTRAEPQHRANVALIREAPALYEALAELVRVQMDGDWEYWQGARERAEAALAAARGDSDAS